MRIKNSPISFTKRILFRVKVEGMSAWPALVPSRRYFASCLVGPQIGDFIVFKNPKNEAETFVKRVAAKTPEGFVVEGLLEGSSSSADFGIVPQSIIFGKILFVRKN